MRVDPRQTTGPAAHLPKLNSEDPSFAEMLQRLLQEVNDAQRHSRAMQNDYLEGKPVEIHDLMIAMERASVSMQLTMQVRNKLLEAWQEIQRTQV
jgi:flagellar hook-basal body complex protein FliE